MVSKQDSCLRVRCLAMLPPDELHPSISLPDVSFSIDGIVNLLQGLDGNKSPGLDGIPANVLKTCALEIAPILQVIFTVFNHKLCT